MKSLCIYKQQQIGIQNGFNCVFIQKKGKTNLIFRLKLNFVLNALLFLYT